MTVMEAVGSMQQIQSTLTQLFGPKDVASSTSASATAGGASASATAFAQALSGAQGASTGIANPAGATGNDVVADAKKYLGVPYVFGGEDASGVDCSGLVQRVFADLGVSVPRVVQDQATVGTEVPSLAQAQPGDLIVLKGNDHIVIYAGNGKVIHAPSEGRNVQMVDNWLTDDQIGTIRRIVPSTASSVASSAASASSSAASLSTSSDSTSLMAALQAAMATGTLS
ncbi:hypothetical protein ASC63_12340 [Leifsonia sp. Root112D2]|jgi:cell wall-associated NlpC family hydrolase|nr:hypothetical protein ASC63_12340 [Leifsonia sp. Root112D2]